jgi:superfamily II DNA or RNA helicase
MLTPRYYQSDANAAVWKYLCEDQGNPLVILPTGAGKSLVIALLIEQARKFDGRVIVLQHRKELIEQNAAELQELMPGVDVGIYSAGLKSRQTSHDVLMAGIQSIYKRAADIGERHLILIDEAHLVSQDDESMYGQFLAEVRLKNPKCRVVGLTATPFRTGEGPLCGKKKLFQFPVYEAFTGDLIKQGFLCPITNKPADADVDTEGIKTRGGEFIESDMQAAFMSADNTALAVREIVENCHDRKSILIFCAGVNHAEDTAKLLEKTGERVGLVTGETLAIERSGILSDFKSQSLRWLVNCDVLTTGFNAKCVDAIAIMRATMSPGLFCQMVGRGLRLHPSKANCIAEGQRVLTDRGLVEIQNVKTSMKVWDGVEFVSHCGIVLRGESPVISYAGLTATEDHNVWTKEGWMPFWQAYREKAGISVTGFGEQAIRESNNCFRDDHSQGKGSCLRADSVCRMQQAGGKKPGFNPEKNCGLSQMRKEAKHFKTCSWCSALAVKQVHIRQGEMHKSKQSFMEKLRRAWNYVRICFAKSDGGLSHRELRDNKGERNRQNRQQQRVFTRQHSSCHSANKFKQSQGKRRHKKDAQIPIDVSGNKICRQHSIEASSNNDFQGSYCKISQEVDQAKRRVWDILNAGPRHRFTCEGLLVSNCVILDFGENIKRHGSIDDKNFGRASEEKRGQAARAAALNGRGKPCPACRLDVPANARECECGFIFPVNHQGTSDGSSQLTGQTPPEVWEVVSVGWGKHTKRNNPDAPPTLRIDYECQPVGSEDGLLTSKVSEWVCIEHEGFARVKACLWWQARSIAEVPDTVDDALSLLNRGAARMASQLTTVKDGKYTRIQSCEFAGERPEEWAEEIEQESFGEFSGEGLDVPF